MEGIPPASLALENLDPGYGDEIAALSEETVRVSRQEYQRLKWAAGYYQAQHARGLEREAAFKEEQEKYRAQIRDLKQRLYGKKSEKSRSKTGKKKAKNPRKRGQQKGAPGHGRTDRSHLPVVEEVHDVPEEKQCCQICGRPYNLHPRTEDSEIVEVWVKAHKRKIRRRQYTQDCDCEGTPGMIVAPPAARLFPKSSLGVSIWTTVLINKYLLSQPTHRLCQELAHQGLTIAQGTLTGGLKKLAPFFEPLAKEMHEKQMSEQLFHGDETRWQVFEEREGKIGYRWYLWVIQSASVIYYLMKPGRGADVPKAHFEELDANILEVILVCDRYVAYKCLARGLEVMVLAFCWAHVRRDFLEAARRSPQLEGWMLGWVEDIAQLYGLNEGRLAFWEPTQSLAEQGADFTVPHEQLCRKLTQMEERRNQLLEKKKELHSVQRGLLTSLKNHWEGLLVFLERPEVPMDNNNAERTVRLPVTGRKNYYGSGRVWSAELAALMFTLLQTVLLWKLNPRHWLQAYLQACAENGSQAPGDLSPFLPWEMSPERKAELSRPGQIPWPEASAPLQIPAPPEMIDTS